jgi:hypothetical protein
MNTQVYISTSTDPEDGTDGVVGIIFSIDDNSSLFSFCLGYGVRITQLRTYKVSPSFDNPLISALDDDDV